MKLYHEELKDFLAMKDDKKTDPIDPNAKFLAATRSERAKIIQTLAHLNISDELLGLGVIFFSKTHGIQVSLASGAQEPIMVGAAQLQRIILDRLFNSLPDETKDTIQ